MTTARAHPKFDRPPVSEVACAWYFQPIPIYTAWIGALWSRFQDELPLTQDVPRAPPPTSMTDVMTVNVGLAAPGLEMPRVWFVSEDERRVVQVQHDRFCFNWRRRADDDPYPDFVAVYADFQRHLATFQAFAAEAGWDLQPTQCELTYINTFRPTWTANLGQIGRVMNDLAWRDEPGRVLGPPVGLAWQALFDLPDDDGRMVVTLRGPSSGDPMRLDLVARGANSEGWYARAHQTIVTAFDELTTHEAHRAWARREDS